MLDFALGVLVAAFVVGVLVTLALKAFWNRF